MTTRIPAIFMPCLLAALVQGGGDPEEISGGGGSEPVILRGLSMAFPGLVWLT